MYQYIQQMPDRPDLVNFKEAQRWTAMLAVSPDVASKYILESLIDQVSQGYVNSSIGITNLIETFTKENNHFIKSLADKLQPVVNAGAITAPALPSSKKLVITNQPVAGKPAFNLPPHISNRLQDLQPVAAAVEERVAMQNDEEPGILYALIIGINQYDASKAPLRGSVQDAHNIIKCLNHTELLVSRNTTALLDKEASKEIIQTKLQDILSSALYTDTVLIYFSGHAAAANDNSSLLLGDYDFSRPSPNDSITDHEMKDWVSTYAKNNPRIVFIIDSHTGSRNWLNESNPGMCS